MSDEQPTDPALQDAVRSIRETGEGATAASTDSEATDAAGEQNPNPPLPDWGTDGIPDE